MIENDDKADSLGLGAMSDMGVSARLDPVAAVEVGAVAAAAGARAFATFAMNSGPGFLASLRKEPFLYNVYFSGVWGRYQVAGLRITNPHPDVIYLRNPVLMGGPADRIRIDCVLRGNHEQPRPYEPRNRPMSIGEPNWFQDKELTEAGRAENLLPIMDANGQPVPPLDQIDLCFYFLRKNPGTLFEGETIRVDLAAEGYRTKFTNTPISFLLRNQPLL
jgi:hypothetical protein